ncbi:HAMP domain-containing histidine kinase [Clostridium gasigenes]|uniref:sensor histidine kinase n=1 Tax=Clostridium gasigenes TaxID=94869 RepID=UPI001C0DE0AB|nr:HAMP domain-containing sensor histidine kinase [Clostridium gasigenes]MBU3133750.1 HAMP domain-containing histidine kinase [Clostridium gasigenes]
MKNKRLYKYWLASLADIARAVLLTYITLVISKEMLVYLYRYTTIQLVNYIWQFWRLIKYGIFGDSIYVIIGVLLFSVFYLLITYRKTKSLVAIIDETEIMANGDLDRLIEVKSKGDIKNLAKNINNISKQLKDITVEERRAQQTKSDLITNVSHDLRTPLTSIMGYLEIIDTDQYKDEVSLRYYANIAYEKSKNLNLLINDLFELTKMQNNTIKLDKVDINLVELLGQVVAYFEYQFNSEKMQSRVKFSDDKLIVNADTGKLVRAFENLLSNAIKYGQDGYYVDVVTKIEENMAVVQIINYGQSISSIDLPYIFDRLYRVEKSRNSNIGGSGLGLAITKNIIDLHQGMISAYSDNDKTIFEVRLPIK